MLVSPQSILEYFYCYPVKTLYSRSKLCLLPIQSSQSQASTELLPVSVGLQIILDISYQWNQTAHGLWEGLLSISIVFSRSIHVATCNNDFYCANTSPYSYTFYAECISPRMLIHALLTTALCCLCLSLG